MTSDQYGKCLAVAWAVPASDAGYSYNSQYPQITGSAPNKWRYWYQYFILQEVPPGTIVLCGMTLPAYVEDLVVARAAADALSVTYLTTDSVEEVCDRIIAVKGYPPLDN